MDVTIVGGCFAVQHNVEPSRLYHQTMRRELARAGVAATVRVVRYERMSTCRSKVEAALDAAPGPDPVVLFHLRTEPVMRLTKLYYRYHGPDDTVCHALNVPGRLPMPERHDLLALSARGAVLHASRPRGPSDRRLVTANYLLGTLVGNRAAALRRYRDLVAAVGTTCRERRVRLVVCGPASRPCSRFEDTLSERIDAAFAGPLRARGVPYVRVLGTTGADGRPLFFPNGIHVSPAGHDRIGRRIARTLLEASQAEDAFIWDPDAGALS